MYSATSFVISSGHAHNGSNSNKGLDLTLQERTWGHQVHSATLATASITHKTMLARLAMPLQGRRHKGR